MRSTRITFRKALRPRRGTPRSVPPIQNMISRGQEILVQVTKEESGKKGVALTTYLSLAGNFLVLTPGDPQIGISRKIEAEEERTRLKETMAQLQDPRGDRLHCPHFRQREDQAGAGQESRVPAAALGRNPQPGHRTAGALAGL